MPVDSCPLFVGVCCPLRVIRCLLLLVVARCWRLSCVICELFVVYVLCVVCCWCWFVVVVVACCSLMDV